jgi:hypothetical protein
MSKMYDEVSLILDLLGKASWNVSEATGMVTISIPATVMWWKINQVCGEIGKKYAFRILALDNCIVVQER